MSNNTEILKSLHPLNEDGKVVLDNVDISNYDLRCIKEEIYAKKYDIADYREPQNVYDVYHAVYNLKGESLSYLYMDFWREMVMDPCFSTNVDMSERKAVWKCSRQVGKSINDGVLAVNLCLEHKYFTVIITQPTDTQISRFSVDVLKKLNRESFSVETFYYDPRTTERQGKNKSYTTNSRIILANIYASVLSARGIPGDAYIADEVQDTPPHHLAIVEQALNRSKYRFRLYSGTPKQPENHLQKLFDQSTGSEWMVPCGMCGRYNGPLGLKNIGKEGLICQYCGARLKAIHGVWADARPNAPISGYHANELMVPPEAPFASSWKELLFKIENSDMLVIQNEILGNSYTDNVHPISLEDVYAACNPNVELIYNVKDITSEMKEITFAGLDWALEMDPNKKRDQVRSFTTFTIASWSPNRNKLTIRYVKRYYRDEFEDANQPDRVIDDIVFWCNAFNVRIIGMDYGAGHKDNQRIVKHLGVERTMEFMYHGELIAKRTYDAYHNYFLLVRTDEINDFIYDFKKTGIYELPKYPGQTSEYASDLTSIYKYNEPHKRYIRYGKTGPDDWMHTLIFIRLAWLYATERLVYETKGEM
jgi:hypothetical protein